MWFYLRPDAVSVWRDDEVKKRLEWYYLVMTDSMPAKFRITKKIRVEEDPYDIDDLKELWGIHEKLSKEFDSLFNSIRNGSINIDELEEPDYSFLDVKIAIAWKIVGNCHLCERRCGVNRIKGERGFCRLNSKAIAHSWFHHYGEEAPLVPSGTIFYGSCNFRCVYCIDEDDYLLARVDNKIVVEKIKDIVEYFRNGKEVEVLTLKGWRRIKDIVGRVSHVIYEIVTNRGKKVKLTPEHIIIVQDDNNLKEVYTKDLVIGAKLITLPYNDSSKLELINILVNPIESINLIEEFDKLLSLELKEKIRIKNVTPTLREIREKYNISYKELMNSANIKNFRYGWLYSDSYPLPEFIKLYRKYREIRENISQYLISMKKGVKHYIPALIKITPNLMRLLGYFAAEGNYHSDYGLVFTTSDKKIQNDIIRCIKTLVKGANTSKLIYNYKGKVPQIIIASKLLYILFKYVFGIGRKTPNKSFPWIVYNVRKELLKEFLSAYLTSDGTLGSVRERVLYIRFITTSERIAYELAYLLGLYGIQYRIKERMPSSKHLLPTGHRSKNKQYWIEVNGIKNVSRLTEIALFFDEDRRSKLIQFLSSIRKAKKVIKDDFVAKISIIRSKRKVYDIILDSSTDDLEEHVFFAGSGILIHNCQNYDISQVYPLDGVVVDAKSLALIQKKLREEGARNINHVGGDPTPNLHIILESLKYLDVNVPQLWNSNMYCSTEAMKLLREVIDIWLPDFKYGNNECAERLSMVKNYFEVVSRNIKWAHDWSDIIIRHLVLPNHIECCTRPVLEWIAKNTPRALVNVMDQYRPEFLVVQYPEKYKEITRRLKRDEILKAYSIADELGIVYKQIS